MESERPSLGALTKARLGAPSKKPRLILGSVRLPGLLSMLVGLAFADRMKFKLSKRRVNELRIFCDQRDGCRLYKQRVQIAHLPHHKSATAFLSMSSLASM